jgi:hypothetical protein
VAAAEPARPVDLRVRRIPTVMPTTLAMRSRRPPPIQVPAAPIRTAAAQPAAAANPPPPASTASLRAAAGAETGDPIKRLEEKVIFRFSLGFGIDGGEPSDSLPLIAEGNPNGRLDRETEYTPLRSYGFGDVVLGTRGLLLSSVGTYFATEFRADYSGGNLPGTVASEGTFTGAVPSVYYADDDTTKVLFRIGYAEADGMFERKWLKPLYLRAGRQYKYGVAVAHFDGATFGYQTRVLSLNLWGGQRVSLYGLDEDIGQSAPIISGSGARFDLSELKLKRKIPIVLTSETLDYEEIEHREFGLALRWSDDVMIRASGRRLGRSFSRQTLSVWTRLSQVTTINMEVDNRTSDDWMYDLMMVRPVTRAGDPRAYLNLGRPLPRLQLDARAGTVILRNLDVLLRAAAAIEHAGGDVDEEFSPSYLEAGGALEVRLRRNIRLGSTFVARRYGRDPIDPVDDPPGPQPILDPDDEIGELSFYEGGLNVDYSMGARRFNASAEFYGRAYERQTPYEDTALDGFDTHSGGRFTVEGWAQSRLRLKAEYDVSLGPLDTAPELRGVKMLRVLAEGSF